MQTKPIADHPPEARAFLCIPKTKRRSIEEVETTLPIYNAINHANLPVMITIDTGHASFLQAAAGRIYVWLMARLSDEDVCSWTELNILTRDTTPVQ